MTRLKLSNRREAERLEFVFGGNRFLATIGLTPGGDIGEVFLTTSKPGSALEAMARDLAIVTSIALQHGATIDELRHSLTRLNGFAAAGPLGELLDHLAERALS